MAKMSLFPIHAGQFFLYGGFCNKEDGHTQQHIDYLTQSNFKGLWVILGKGECDNARILKSELSKIATKKLVIR